MDSRQRARLIVALAIATVGGVVAVRAVWRANVVPVVNMLPPQPINTPGFLPDSEVKYDAYSRKSSAAAIATRAAERLNIALAALPADQALSPERASALVSLYEERIGMLLQPDLDVWLEHIRHYGAEPVFAGGATAFDSDGTILPKFRLQWENGASRLAQTPLELEQLWVRPRWIEGRRIEAPITAIYLGPDITAPYPVTLGSPEVDMLDVYEVIVPAGFRSANAKDVDNVVHLGLMFAWEKEHDRWSPYQMMLYRPMSSFNGGAMRLPVF